MAFNKKLSCISGIGQSKIGRRLEETSLALTVDACLEAIEDAGLTRADIDGLATYPGGGAGGFSPIGAPDLKDALRLDLNWYFGGGEVAGQLGAIFNACAAVAAGVCNHVLVFRTVAEAQYTARARALEAANPSDPADRPRVATAGQWSAPYLAASAANWIAMFATKHFERYGTTREQLAWIALNERKNAALNPKAIYTEPMTMEDYLSVRMVTTPLSLYDCDVPCDGSTAVVVSRKDHAKDLRKTPIGIEAVGTAFYGRNSWQMRDDLTTMAAHDVSKQMWTRTDLKPSDVDVACLYDGFSWLTMSWLEALGFCGEGESGPFIEGGERIAIGGDLPVNPHGGQLSAGRTHGFGFLHEACTQLWGEADARQVPNNPQVAAVGAGGGPVGGCMLLTRA